MLAVNAKKIERGGERRKGRVCKIREDFHNTGTKPNLEKEEVRSSKRRGKEHLLQGSGQQERPRDKVSFGMLDRQIRNPSIRDVCASQKFVCGGRWRCHKTYI